MLDLPDNLGISHIFNVEDLTLHRATFEPPKLLFGASGRVQILKLPPFPQSHTYVEAMFDDEFVLSYCGAFVASRCTGAAADNQMPLGLRKMSFVR